MTFVVCQPCKKCESRSCVRACPVGAFREDRGMMVIAPKVCIDCGACVGDCPVNAIRADHEVPRQWRKYIRLNALRSKVCPAVIH